MAPNAEVEAITTMTSSQSKVHSLKAAIFHTMAYKRSLEINKNKINSKTIIAFLKVLYNVAQIKTKKITIEQYSRIHLAGPKVAICETASNAVFVLNSAFTSKDQYFKTAIQEAILAFNNVLKTVGTPKPLHTTTLMCIKHILRRNILYYKNFHSLLFYSSTTFRLHSFIFLR